MVSSSRDSLADSVMWDIAMIIAVLVTLLCAALVMADDTDVAAMTSVRLREGVSVAGPRVLLSDVADVTGRDAERIGATVVATLGAKEPAVTVTRDTVRLLLTESGVHWGMVTLRGYTACRVTKLETEQPRIAAGGPVAAISNPDGEIGIDAALTLRERVIQLVEGATNLPRNELQITFNDNDESVLQRGVLGERYEFEPVVSGARGRIPVVVRRYDGDRVVETLTLHVDVARRYLAAVAVRGVSRGQTFGPGDVEIREVFLDDARDEPLTELGTVIGQTASGAVREGAVLFAQDLRSPVLVRRGDLVTVRCFVGGLVIKTVGRAAADGMLGDQISVRNERSKETFVARVTGFREAVTAAGVQVEDKT